MHTYLLILMGLYICILTHLWQLGHYAYILALTYGIQVIAASQTGQPACQLPTRQPSSRTTQPASQPKKNESSKQAIKQTSEKHINQPNHNHPKRPTNQTTNNATCNKNNKLTSQTKDHVNTQAKSHRINVHNPFEWVGGSAPHINNVYMY